MPVGETGLCDSCRELKPVAFTDEVGREFCADCIGPTPLDYLLLTIPFAVGDRVEARTAGALFDGTGVIDAISMDPREFGTPIHPSFHVVIDQPAYPEAPDELWYTAVCLKKVKEPSK